MKQHSLVSLQIGLVYLWKKKKERKRLDKIAKKKAKEKAKKEAEKEKKRLKLLKIKNKRKDKKRKYKTLLNEAVKIIYYKEEERREVEFQKLKRKVGGARKLEKNKDCPIDTVTWSVQPLFFRPIYKTNEKKLEDWKERKKKEREAAKKKKTTTKKKGDGESALSNISGGLETSATKTAKDLESKVDGESVAETSEL